MKILMVLALLMSSASAFAKIKVIEVGSPPPVNVIKVSKANEDGTLLLDEDSIARIAILAEYNSIARRDLSYVQIRDSEGKKISDNFSSDMAIDEIKQAAAKISKECPLYFYVNKMTDQLEEVVVSCD